MIYLICMAHAASQLPPTHICLVVASDYFHITLGELVRKTLPLSAAFCALITIYYQVLTLICTWIKHRLRPIRSRRRLFRQDTD